MRGDEDILSSFMMLEVASSNSWRFSVTWEGRGLQFPIKADSLQNYLRAIWRPVGDVYMGWPEDDFNERSIDWRRLMILGFLSTPPATPVPLLSPSGVIYALLDTFLEWGPFKTFCGNSSTALPLRTHSCFPVGVFGKFIVLSNSNWPVIVSVPLLCCDDGKSSHLISLACLYFYVPIQVSV